MLRMFSDRHMKPHTHPQNWQRLKNSRPLEPMGMASMWLTRGWPPKRRLRWGRKRLARPHRPSPL